MLSIPAHDGTLSGFWASQPDAVDIATLVAAMGGTGVVDDCAVGPDGAGRANYVSVNSGIVSINGVWVSITPDDLPIIAPDADYPRFDLVQVNASGTLSWKQGTASARPRYPNPDSNQCALAVVYLEPGLAWVDAETIVDKRCFVTPTRYVAKKTIEVRSNSATPLEDAALSTWLPAGKDVWFRCKVWFETPATADFFCFMETSVALASMNVQTQYTVQDGLALTVSVNWTGTDLGTAQMSPAASVAGVGWCLFEGKLRTTFPTRLYLKWAQLSSVASATFVHGASHLICAVRPDSGG